MRIIYEVNDGTRFNTAEECERYESKDLILLDQKNFLCFDEALHPIKLDKEYSFAEFLEKTYFFICFTQEAAEALEEKADEAGESNIFPFIHKDTLYGWDVDNNDCWSDVCEVVEELEMQASYLREVVTSINDEIEKAKQGK